MKTYDLSGTIVDFNGKELKRPEAIDEKTVMVPVTVYFAITESLLAIFNDEKESGYDKVKKFMLAKKINNNPKEVSLSSEEVSKIKHVVGKAFGANVVGFVYEALGELEEK